MNTKKRTNKHLNIMNENIPLGGNPAFIEWTSRFFTTPKIKIMYESIDGSLDIDKHELARLYNLYMSNESIIALEEQESGIQSNPTYL